MSDYLWDKTGDADAEVERLEEMLGALRYRPQEFELPPEIEADKPEQRPRSFYQRASYARRVSYGAAAAALLLMLFLGLWPGVLRQQHSAGETERAASQPQPATQPPNVPLQQASSPGGDEQGEAMPSRVVTTGQVITTAGPRPDGLARRDGITAGSPRRNIRDEGRQTFAKRLAPVAPHERDGIARIKTRDAAGANLTAVAYTAAEQREAKSQLMYALRLTSAKLGEVQQKSRTSNDERIVPLQRNITR
ncbi:MAG: hypothetical protein WCD76_10665 [Pyrinomonadaceae bacterium]